MKIIYTDTALQDLQQIKNFISLDSPQNARTFIKQMLNKIDLLVDNPLIYKPSSYHQDLSYREMVFKTYTIVYKVVKNQIYILAIFKARLYSQ